MINIYLKEVHNPKQSKYQEYVNSTNISILCMERKRDFLSGTMQTKLAPQVTIESCSEIHEENKEDKTDNCISRDRYFSNYNKI